MSCREEITLAFKGKLSDADIGKIIDDIEAYKKQFPNASTQDLIERVIDSRKDYLQAKLRLLAQIEKNDINSARIDQQFSVDGINEKNAKDIMFSFISRNPAF